jgi:aspartyl-tRNA(Asn)/glutamyl-tRNA(Gln) amidotransferase subunit A
LSGRADTLAGRSFSEAENLLHDLPLETPRVAPPLDLRIPSRGERGPADPLSPAPSTRRGPGDASRVAPTPRLAKGPTMTEAIAQLAAGQTTTRDLVEAALVVAASTIELGAVVAIDEQSVRDEADRLDAERAAGRSRGPLHGIPLTVKDVIDVSGLPTRAGSLAYYDAAPADGGAVARLRAAGALLLAKVATHEFALGVATPQCRNPHDPTRISGGSSGGSAIAVATGVGLASLGTDTRASLRVPAHCCGVVGFKPTFGRVPVAGIVPLSWTIDHLGPITRTVEDAGALLEVLAGEPFLDHGGAAATRSFAVGIVPAVFEDAEADVVSACEAALVALERLGCRIVELAGPDIADLEVSNALGLLISRSEAAAFHRAQGTDLERCIPEVRDQLAAGLTISAADYLDAQRQRSLLSERTLAHFDTCDVVASPTAPLVAPPHADYERYLLRLSRNTIIWSLAGAPALSMPCGADAGGIPIGLQLASPPGREQDLVTLGTALEGLHL